MQTNDAKELLTIFDENASTDNMFSVATGQDVSDSVNDMTQHNITWHVSLLLAFSLACDCLIMRGGVWWVFLLIYVLFYLVLCFLFFSLFFFKKKHC